MSLGSKHKVGKRFYTHVEGASMTKQSFADECNVDKVVGKFMKTGNLPVVNQRDPVFLDVSQVPSYDEALRFVESAESAFMALDPNIRFRFNNDPSMFLSFVGDSRNRAEAVKLGLIADKRKAVVKKSDMVRRSTDDNRGTARENFSDERHDFADERSSRKRGSRGNIRSDSDSLSDDKE